MQCNAAATKPHLSHYRILAWARWLEPNIATCDDVDDDGNGGGDYDDDGMVMTRIIMTWYAPGNDDDDVSHNFSFILRSQPVAYTSVDGQYLEYLVSTALEAGKSSGCP